MICQFCNTNEAMTDDIGEWYLWPDPEIKEGRVCCWECYQGEPGRKHIKRYGQGER